MPKPHDDLEPHRPEADALVREYLDADPLGPLSRSVTRALNEWFEAAAHDSVSDPLLVEARRIIGHHGLVLHPEVNRALHGHYLSRVQSDPDWLDDANGTAKLMLLGIEALLPAVEAVALAAPRDRKLRLALANLPVVRALLLERFPRAMEYVRPGWDD